PAAPALEVGGSMRADPRRAGSLVLPAAPQAPRSPGPKGRSLAAPKEPRSLGGAKRPPEPSACRRRARSPAAEGRGDTQPRRTPAMPISPKSFLYALNEDTAVATITLNRPERLNALTFEVYEELRDTFYALDTEPGVRAIVITGAGRAFCSGGDVE